MKYRGKYSLKENLAGRGLRLINEGAQTWKGGWKSECVTTLLWGGTLKPAYHYLGEHSPSSEPADADLGSAYAGNEVKKMMTRYSRASDHKSALVQEGEIIVPIELTSARTNPETDPMSAKAKSYAKKAKKGLPSGDSFYGQWQTDYGTPQAAPGDWNAVAAEQSDQLGTHIFVVKEESDSYTAYYFNAAVPAKNYGPRQYNTLDRPAIQFALELSNATETKTISKADLRTKAIAGGMPAAAAAKL